MIWHGIANIYKIINIHPDFTTQRYGDKCTTLVKVMKKIKISITDSWPRYAMCDFPFLHLLRHNYEVELSDEPEYLFYSCIGTEFLKYNDCIRIFCTTENVRPDFNFCDYAIGFDRMSFGERYIRLPICAVRQQLASDKDYLNRKFCNFIYSNNGQGQGARDRTAFCKKLAQYKKVDCPGAVLNNMQDCISPRTHLGTFEASKIRFISNYKFTIAWENSYYPGYATEKLMHPFVANSIPIYMGDPDIEIDFNEKAFVNINRFKSWQDAIDYIIFLDNNDSAYLDMLRAEPMLPDYKRPNIDAFILNIIENGRRFPKNIHYNINHQPYGHFSRLIARIKKAFTPVAAALGNEQLELLDKMIYAKTPQQQNLFTKLEIIASKTAALAGLPAIMKVASASGTNRQAELANQRLGVLIAASARAVAGCKTWQQTKWMWSSPLQEQYRILLNLLWPHDNLRYKKVRIGEKGDGGCVMLDYFPGKQALSLGKKGRGFWELELAQKGIKVSQYENSLASTLQPHSNIELFVLKVTPTKNDAQNISIHALMEKFKDAYGLIMRLDVEGAEWDILEAIAPTHLECFAQIYVEFHKVTNSNNYMRYKTIIQKLLRSHLPVHLHYNNAGPAIAFQDFMVADLIEVTFANKKLGSFTPSQETYPCALDYANCPLPEYYIGKFNVFCPNYV